MHGKFVNVFLVFLIALTAGAASNCFCQDHFEINGRVIERTSTSVLPYAHIGIKNSSIGTVSNELGLFKLIVPNSLKPDTLVVSYLGYKTYLVPISALEKSCDIYLDEQPLVLKDVVIDAKRLSAEDLLYKAVENLLQNASYPTADFKLEGFYREVQRTDKKTVFLVESAFNIYDDVTTHPLAAIEIKEFRKILNQVPLPDMKMYNHNNLLRLFDISTNFVVLAKHGLKAGKTTWAIGNRPYEIADVSVYNGKEVYVIIHDNDHVSLKVIVDANNFSVLRNEYHSKQAPQDFNNYFWKYRRGNLRCGFYETHQVYEYREFKGKLYPYFFYRNDCSKCFDSNGTVQNESLGKHQALISKIELGQKSPERLKHLKKHKGMQDMDFKYNAEFWKRYNIIRDLPQE